MDEESVKRKGNLAVKIGIPILLMCIVAGIWIIKNKHTTPSDNINTNTDFSLLVTEKLDLEKLKSYGLPIVIDFGSDQCIPCKEMAPVLKELNEELQGKAIIRFVDVWKYSNLAYGYPISAIPTQVFFDAEGNPFNPKDPEALLMSLYSNKDSGKHVFTTHEGGVTKEQLLAVLEEMGMK